MIVARPWLRNLAGLLVAAACAPACAAVFAVTEPWVRPAGAGATTEAYMELASSMNATLVDARSAVAACVALVSTGQRKRPPFTLALPARTNVMLAPGGVRLALVNLAQPLNLGQRVPITLVLNYADGTSQDIEVDAEVRRRSPSDDHHVPHKH